MLHSVGVTSICSLVFLTWLYAILHNVEAYSYEDRTILKEDFDNPKLGPFSCPGLYCGRTLVNNTYYSKCGKCDRGWRVGDNIRSRCEKCSETPTKNDWFFLAFHVIFVLVLHWVAIDFSARRRSFTKEVLLLHTCAFFEVATAALVTGIHIYSALCSRVLI